MVGLLVLLLNDNGYWLPLPALAIPESLPRLDSDSC